MPTRARVLISDTIVVPQTPDMVDFVPGHGQALLVLRKSQTIPESSADTTMSFTGGMEAVDRRKSYRWEVC